MAHADSKCVFSPLECTSVGATLATCARRLPMKVLNGPALRPTPRSKPSGDSPASPSPANSSGRASTSAFTTDVQIATFKAEQPFLGGAAGQTV